MASGLWARAYRAATATAGAVFLATGSRIKAAEGYLPVELFHHVNGDESGKESQRWASFALSSARPLYGSKTKGFLLTYPTSSGKAVRKIDIKPNTSQTP